MNALADLLSAAVEEVEAERQAAPDELELFEEPSEGTHALSARGRGPSPIPAGLSRYAADPEIAPARRTPTEAARTSPPAAAARGTSPSEWPSKHGADPPAKERRPGAAPSLSRRSSGNSEFDIEFEAAQSRLCKPLSSTADDEFDDFNEGPVEAVDLRTPPGPSASGASSSFRAAEGRQTPPPPSTLGAAAKPPLPPRESGGGERLRARIELPRAARPTSAPVSRDVSPSPAGPAPAAAASAGASPSKGPAEEKAQDLTSVIRGGWSQIQALNRQYARAPARRARGDGAGARAASAAGPAGPASAAEQEWEDVERLRAAAPAERRGVAPGPQAALSYDEAAAWFASRDLSDAARGIQAEAKRPAGVLAALAALFSRGASWPKAPSPLTDERDRVFTYARVAFDNEEPMHLRVLQSVFMKLTGAKLPCPRYGKHWDIIGFQGTDPATDLRGVGMFGLLQILYFASKHGDLAREVHRLSRDEYQSFPFAVVSLNVSRLALEALREGRLTDACRRRAAVAPVVHEFAFGALFDFYSTWKAGRCTIKDFDSVFYKELTAKCKKRPEKILAAFKEATNPSRRRIDVDKDAAPLSFMD
eukprot:tig00001130_g7256.t1